MKTVLASLVGISMVCGAAWATPPQTLVDEDFDGGGWPPTGWSVERHDNANWILVMEDANNYALGGASGGSQCYAYLKTFKFSLSAGTKLDIGIMYKGTSSGSGMYDRYIELYNDNTYNQVWHSADFGNQDWGAKNFTTTAVPTTDNGYRIQFFLGIVPDPHVGLDVTYGVDDVLVKVNNVAVEPASFGRIKALYR